MNTTRNPIAKVVSAACLALACIGTPAQAASPGAGKAYPTKPVRLVIPFPPGASSDVIGRLLQLKLTEYLGEQVLPDNRPGAGGNLAIGATAKSPPDGYTIVLATASIAVSPSLYKNLGYDPVKDLAPVARLVMIPNILLVHPSVPAKTLREFVDLARKHPGKLNFGSGGAGTTNHLANELLKSLEKIDIVHVPYKGVTQAVMQMVSGEVDEVVMPISTALPQIRAGRVRPLAVLTEKRVASLPDVPTGIEAGVPKFTMPLWYGMFAPAGTPRAVVSRLNQALAKALNSADVRDRLKSMSVDPWHGTPEELRELLSQEIVRYGAVARAAGLKPQ